MSWAYDGGDIGLQLFTACIEAGAPLRVEPGMRVLEIGCCECDWLHLAHDAWPEVEFVGLDTRAPNVTDGDGKVTRICGDVRDARRWAPESFDAIVSLSAIEHIGLGHYNDPVDPDGDTQAVTNAWRWLKPGGWFYFDVPYDPSGYRLHGIKCRIYDDASLASRFAVLGQPAWIDYAHGHAPRTLMDKPLASTKPFYYVAQVFQKPTP